MTEPQKQSKPPHAIVIDFLASIKLGLALLISLAITSIIGTLIPQNATYSEYVQNYGAFFTNIVASLELFDMYHSWWFVFLLAFFSINIIFCSLKRLPGVIAQIRNPVRILDEDLEKSFSLKDTVKKRGSAEVWKNTIKEYLNKKFGTAYEEKKENVYFLYYEKGRYSRLGVYLTHLSILIILVGGMIGAYFGYRGFVNIAEGGQANQVTLRQRPPQNMGFTLRCDDFSLGYYPNGMVKEYRSDVTVIENGKEVEKASLRVNHPLRYKDLTFYQSNYGVVDRQAKVRVIHKSGKNSGKSYELNLGDKFVQIPFSSDFARVTHYYPNLENYGPAMIVEIAEDGFMPRETPVFKNLPDSDYNPQSKYFFKYVDYSESYYTGLQVTKDPGDWLVWVGCTIMMAGLYLSFFMVRTRLWARIFYDGDKTVVAVAGHSPRSRVFDDEFTKVINEIKEMKI